MSLWSSYVHRYDGEITALIPYNGFYSSRVVEREIDREHDQTWRISADATCHANSFKFKQSTHHSRILRLYIHLDTEILIQKLSIVQHVAAAPGKGNTCPNGSFSQEVRGLVVGPKECPLTDVELTSFLFSYNPPKRPRRSRNTFPIVFKITVEFLKRTKQGDVEDCSCGCQRRRDTSAESLRSSLVSDLAKQIGDAETSDFSFEIGDEVIPAHKWILQARVPFFKTMFASGMIEATTNKMKIEDTDAQSFKHVLKFIYCGELPEVKVLKVIAPTILPIAEKYGLEELKRVCAATLQTNLEQHNVVATLMLADIYRCSSLRSSCIEKLAYWRDSVNKDELEPLKKLPELLFEVFTLNNTR